MNNILLKAIAPYSGAYLIEIIWGVKSEDVNRKELNPYRAKIHRRLTGKVAFEKLEVEKLIAFLKTHRTDIDEFLQRV